MAATAEAADLLAGNQMRNLDNQVLENEGRAAVSVEQVSSLLPHPVARDDRLSGRAARAAARAGRMLLRFVEGRPVSLVTCAFLA
jgi:hypothetical protein